MDSGSTHSATFLTIGVKKCGGLDSDWSGVMVRGGASPPAAGSQAPDGSAVAAQKLRNFVHDLGCIKRLSRDKRLRRGTDGYGVLYAMWTPCRRGRAFLHAVWRSVASGCRAW